MLKLSKNDKLLYQKIISKGNMEDMFNFGFNVGKIESLNEQMRKIMNKV